MLDIRTLLLGILLISCAVPLPAFGAVEKQEKRVFGGATCTPKPACLINPDIPKLKEFGFWVRDWRLPSTGSGDHEAHSSSMYAWYETVDTQSLEDFAFVQYVRGCVYSSQRNASGEITYHHNVTHQSLGERKIFIHLDFIVDSATTDPMFDSNPKFSPRHYFMGWNKNPDQFPSSVGRNFGDGPPVRPRLFMLHSPAPYAHVPGTKEDFATSHSLEYRTCLYRTKDIPITSDGGVIPGAIGCFNWASSHVYDYAHRRFTSPDGIVPACRPEKLPSLTGPW